MNLFLVVELDSVVTERVFFGDVTCQVFGDEADMYKIEDVQIQDLGKVGEITITKDDCLLMKVMFCYQCDCLCKFLLFLQLFTKFPHLQSLLFS